MTIDFSLHALLAYLKANQLQPELQKETGQTFIMYEIQNFEVPVFFLLHSESKLLQLVAYLPYHLPEKTLGETARLLHILNKELDMPGFGLDENEKLMFYRAVLPCLDGKIETRLFNMYLGTARIACETFMHAIGVIVSGSATVDALMKEKKRQENA
jgi:hypothetical protein